MHSCAVMQKCPVVAERHNRERNTRTSKGYPLQPQSLQRRASKYMYMCLPGGEGIGKEGGERERGRGTREGEGRRGEGRSYRVSAQVDRKTFN